MYLITLIIIGNTSVGKTSLLVRYYENNFIPEQKTTVGVDYKAKEIDIDGEVIKMQIWDTAGQERFRSMTSAFYKKAQGIVLVFDVKKKDSFKSLSSWIVDLRETAPDYCVLFLCANKIDAPPDQWEVKKEEYISFARENNLMLIECSAADGSNVIELFNELARQVLLKNRTLLSQIDDADLRRESKADGRISLGTFVKQSNAKSRRKCCVK